MIKSRGTSTVDGLAHNQEVGSSNFSPATLSMKDLIKLKQYAEKHGIKPKIIETVRQAKSFNEIEKRIYNIIGGNSPIVWKIGMKYYELPLRELKL